MSVVTNSTIGLFLYGGLLCLSAFSPTAYADLDTDKHPGKALYQRCAACHLDTAKGVPGMFPPLTQRLGALTDTQQGRDYLVMVIQAGLMGGIQVEGIQYQGYMPAQGIGMKDEEVASVLNYLLETFNAETLKENWTVFTSSEVSSIRSRHPNMNGQKVHALRQPVLK